MRRLLFDPKVFLFLLCLGTVLAIGFGFAGQLHPALDTFSHLRFHFALFLIALSLLIVIIGPRLIAPVTILIGISTLATTLNSSVWQQTENQRIAGKPTYTLLHFNLLWDNPKKKQVIENIRSLSPDLISLIEISEQWKPELDALQANWPHQLHCPEWSRYGGLKIFSKLPFDSSEDFCGFYGSFGKTRIIFPGGQVVGFGSVHPRWPWPATGPKQFASFEPTLIKLEEDALIVGDFNATPWSYSVTRFSELGHLKLVNGIGGTWLLGIFPEPMVRLLGFPIDYALTKGRIHVISAESLRGMGSDHLPVLVRFQLR